MQNKILWDEFKMLIGFGTILVSLVFFFATISVRQEGLINRQLDLDNQLDAMQKEQISQGKDIAVIKEALKGGLISKEMPINGTIAKAIPNVMALE